MKYKVWISVEEIDEETDHYGDVCEPDWLAEFDTEAEAVSYRDKVRDNAAWFSVESNKDKTIEMLIELLSVSTDELAKFSRRLKAMSRSAGRQVLENLTRIATYQKGENDGKEQKDSDDQSA